MPPCQISPSLQPSSYHSPCQPLWQELAAFHQVLSHLLTSCSTPTSVRLPSSSLLAQPRLTSFGPFCVFFRSISVLVHSSWKTSPAFSVLLLHSCWKLHSFSVPSPESCLLYTSFSMLTLPPERPVSFAVSLLPVSSPFLGISCVQLLLFLVLSWLQSFPLPSFPLLQP